MLSPSDEQLRKKAKSHNRYNSGSKLTARPPKGSRATASLKCHPVKPWKETARLKATLQRGCKKTADAPNTATWTASTSEKLHTVLARLCQHQFFRFRTEKTTLQKKKKKKKDDTTANNGNIYGALVCRSDTGTVPLEPVPKGLAIQ